jgi:outer membrane immunogenic protein
MKQYLLAAALLISASASVTTAIAADLDPPPPPVDDLRGTSYDWTGAYAGGWVGSACVDGTLTDNSGTPGGTFENSGCGWKGGVVAGYNHQIDSIVIGLEGDWGMSNKIATNEETAVDFSFAFDHIATLRARLGYAFDDTLLYVTAGGAYATGDVDGIISNVPDHINADHWGWTAGIGMEHAITDNFRLRLDYLYTDLGKSDYQEACCDTTVDLKGEHEIRLGGVWAFNGFWMQ